MSPVSRDPRRLWTHLVTALLLALCAQLSQTQALAAPAVTGVTPNTIALPNNALTLTVNGSGFVTGSTVIVGTNTGSFDLSTQAKRVFTMLVTLTSIRVIGPTLGPLFSTLLPSGDYTLTVKNPDGTLSNTVKLTVNP